MARKSVVRYECDVCDVVHDTDKAEIPTGWGHIRLTPPKGSTTDHFLCNICYGPAAERLLGKSSE